MRPATRGAAAGDRPGEGPPRREAFALAYCLVALTFVYLHGTPRSLAGDAQLFAWFGINFAVLFAVPALIVRLAWRRPLRAYGLGRGRQEVWGRYLVVYLALMIPLVLIISRNPQFQMYYPRAMMARHGFGGFVLSSLGWLVYFFAWEWFFRGFLLFSLAPRYGGGIAILIQTIPFAMMHYPKPEAEAWSSIACGLALGLMAFRGRSFVGCWLLHWSVQVLMDLSVVSWPLR